MGEISVHADQVTLLSKNLVPLPEKFHGLQDTDIRYRQRYLDLIMNRDVRTTFEKRSQIIKEIRNFLDKRDFMEVETPMLVENAGGAAARPFVTHYNALDEDVKLRISLELYLKRLIVGGFERVYEIGRVFRNEGVDTRHNPEFTLMELYQAYTDYNGMMELTESMFRYLAEKVCGSAVIQYEDTVIDMAKPFRRLTMIDAVKEYAGVDFSTIRTDEEAKAVAKAHNVEFEERHKRGDIINLFFEQFCEEKMIQPTFIMDHPVEISPLTKRKPSDPSLVERFELYIYGREMCNAYSELNDPIDQRERFKAQDALAAAGDEEANHTDEDFLHAMEIGMPPTGGIGYGIDRLVMLLTNSSAIRDVLLFPTMKSLNSKKDEGNEGEGVSSQAASEASGSKSGASATASAAGNGASATASAQTGASASAAASASSSETSSAQAEKAAGEASGTAEAGSEASGAAIPKPTPSVPTGVKLDASISYDDALALDDRADRIELELDGRVARLLRRLDERAADVAVLDQALDERQAGLVGIARRGRCAGVRHRDDDIALELRLACEDAAHLETGGMDALTVDDGVRTCEIDVLENAGSELLALAELVRFEAVVVDDDHFARRDVADELGAIDIEAAGLGRQNPRAVIELADAERAEAMRVSRTDELVFRHNGQAIRTLDFLEAFEHFFLNRLLARARDEVHEDLGVDGGLEDRALLLELVADLGGVREVAVVRERDLAACVVDHERLRVRQEARARCRIAHMADGDVLIFHVRQLVAEDLIDEAHATRDVHPRAIRQRDAGALLPAMLQGIEAEVRHFRDIFRPRIDAVDAALLFPFVCDIIHHWLLFPSPI